MPSTKIEINPSERFEHLERAPITEAVFEARTRIESAWDETTVTGQLKHQLSDYPKLETGRATRQTIQFQLGSPTAVPQGGAKTDDLGWRGARLRSTDGKSIGVFERERFSFSRLSPYETWAKFIGEAMRLWAVHRGLGEVKEVQRLGLRFINQIKLPVAHFDLSDYFSTAPNDPAGLILPFTTFFYHDTLAVPGYSYSVNLIKTIQPVPSPTGDGPVLVLDIDVVAPQPTPVDRVPHMLAEMRWLKNKLFFGTLTQKALELLR